MLQEVPQEIAELWRAFDPEIGQQELSELLKVLNKALSLNPNLSMEDLTELSLTMGVGTDNIPSDVLANYQSERGTPTQLTPILGQLGLGDVKSENNSFSRLSGLMGR